MITSWYSTYHSGSHADPSCCTPYMPQCRPSCTRSKSTCREIQHDSTRPCKNGHRSSWDTLWRSGQSSCCCTPYSSASSASPCTPSRGIPCAWSAWSASWVVACSRLRMGQSRPLRRKQVQMRNPWLLSWVWVYLYSAIMEL